MGKDGAVATAEQKQQHTPSPVIPGRIVHYVTSDGSVRAMTLVFVYDEEGKRLVNGQVMRSGPLDPHFVQPTTELTGIEQDEETLKAGTWHFSRA